VGSEGDQSRNLGGADEEGEASGGGEEAGGDREDGLEMFDGAEGDEVGGREASGHGFSAVRDYIDVGQCKCAGDFAEEGGLFVVRFDEGQLDLGRPDFERQAREAGAGADVDSKLRAASFELRVRQGCSKDLGDGRWIGGGGCTHDICPSGEEMASKEKRFAEMSCHDRFWIADSSEIDARIPAQQ